MTCSNKLISDLNSLPEAFNSFFSSIFHCLPLPANLPFQCNIYVPLLSSFYLTPNDMFAALLLVAPKYNSHVKISGFFLQALVPYMSNLLLLFSIFSFIS